MSATKQAPLLNRGKQSLGAVSLVTAGFIPVDDSSVRARYVRKSALISTIIPS